MLEPITLDIPFARKVLEHLVAHPEEHNQCTFGSRQPCGTVACIAGTAVMMDPSPNTTVSWTSPSSDMRLHVDGVERPIDYHATKLMGLTYYQATALFYDMDEKSALDRLESYIKYAEQHQSH